MPDNEIKKDYDVVVIGSGPAGWTSAIYLTRAGYSVAVVTGEIKGGEITNSLDVENFPAFPDAISGFELMDRMEKQALKFGTKIIPGIVKSVDFDDFLIRKIVLENGEELLCNAVVIATGSSPRRLGLPNEHQYIGKGVSYCATCDGFFYKDKTVAIVGGGNSAIYEALYLANMAKEVHIIHRNATFNPVETILIERLYMLQNVKVHTLSQVEGLETKDNVLTGVHVRHKVSNEESVVKVDGVFVAIGQVPNTLFLKGKLYLDEVGNIIRTPDTSMTSVDGVFACGDVAHKYRQLIVASGYGAIAALDAEHYLRKIEAQRARQQIISQNI